ncbi:tripartite motif-containing protein 2-like [Ostrea edulis]|uniref:tripartite motif-containing protein 2-like n=1 Tax=Ostrea edulis TaxID=37623 RepID=UPI0024AF017F|nr:tripartite motif-containing protein 2-like [Ostrea edulis]
MHPRRSAQEVLLCDLCVTVPLQSHCELCHINLCTNCVGKHLSDSSTTHNIVSFKHRKSTPNYPKCSDHAEKHCEIFCEKCDIPVCSTCVTSGKHKGHDISDVLEKLSTKTESLQYDLEELETRLYPRHEEMASDVQTEKAELETNCGKLIIAAEQQGEVLQREIATIVNQRKSVITEMKNKHMAVLDKNQDEITLRITELRQMIQDLRKILDSNDVSLMYTYKCKNAEFKRLPPKIKVTSPSIPPQKLNKEKLREMFGSLPSLSIKTEEQGYTKKTPEAVSSASAKALLDEPRLAATIDTGYEYLSSVSCLSDEYVWTRGDKKIMKLLNLQSQLLTSIKTKSGNEPRDITVTRERDLVYTDPDKRTVNLVKNTQIQTVIRLRGWLPLYICSSSYGDLLVTMISDDYKQSKVARYSGSTETQSIQFDGHGRPLYSSGDIKYISENRNLDICVADYEGKTVVVVNQSGKLRFRYTGHPSNTKKSFDPVGITTDSQSHILTVDYRNHRIHILDKDGQFLRYLQDCGLRRPYGLCVDTRDNLFVAEWNTAKVKKIQYL